MKAARDIRFIPAIDGLRAIAVIAVLLYHLGFTWIPGGFLGVDLFFVISGYVITRLLLDSIQRSGGLDLRGFYKARARRLLPALLFMLITTILFISVWAPEAMKRLLADAPFALTGTMNWALLNRHQDYFEAIGRPSLLQHTWSLAVESQFYLLWPAVLLLVLKRFGKKHISRAALSIAAISGSALLLLSNQLDATNAQSVSHIYFGTDTHSIGLFLGSALAVSWVPQNLSVNVSKRAQDFIDGIGVVGLLGILAAFLFINEANATLYRLAFPLAGIFGCCIIISLVHPASRFAPLLSSKPALWIGQRSYGIYLWHWIVFQLTRPTVDLAGAPWALHAIRLLIVLALADISLRWVERPIRNGSLELWFRGMKYRTRKVQLRQQCALTLGLLGLIASTWLMSSAALASSAQEKSALTKALKKAAQEPIVMGEKTSGIWLTGDSVILGIRFALGEIAPIEMVNARVGRQAEELIAVLRRDKVNMGQSPIILDLGNNNLLTEGEVVQLFEEIKNQPQAIIVNTAVPRSWRDKNDLLIERYAKNYPNVTLIDWRQISAGHPEYFAPDGVHLVPAGVSAYVSAIRVVLRPIK